MSKGAENKRILVFNVNWLGDVLFSTSALKALREAFPTAFIAVIVPERAREILEGNPNIDNILIFDERGKDKHLLSKFKLISHLRKKKFDTVYLFHRSFSRLMLMSLAKIPNRIGYKAKKRSVLLLTKKVPLLKEKVHRRDYFLNILKSCGISSEVSEYEFFVDDPARKRIVKILESEKVKPADFLVVLNPGGNWLLKRWAAQRFAELGNRLIKEFRARIIITGSAKDIALAKQISSHMEEKPINICGKTSLKDLGALVEASKLFISADSGPLHIAAALGTPLIALFGPTSPQITGPKGRGKIKIIHKDVGCQIPCYDVKCRDNRCMQAISVEDVFAAIREINEDAV